MKIALLAMLVSLSAASPGFSEPRAQTADKPAAASRQLPLKGAAAQNSCAAYGAGFVRVAGSETCVRVGGAVSIEAGRAGR